jgi:hypothetical protein
MPMRWRAAMRWKGPLPPDDPIFNRGLVRVSDDDPPTQPKPTEIPGTEEEPEFLLLQPDVSEQRKRFERSGLDVTPAEDDDPDDPDDPDDDHDVAE